MHYADDAVFTFPAVEKAESFRDRLEQRLREFDIKLHPGKTIVLPTGQKAAVAFDKQGKRIPGFTFLGFLHLRGRAKNRTSFKWFWRVKRRTCPKHFKLQRAEVQKSIRGHRHDANLIQSQVQMARGYCSYFTINDN